MYQSEINTQDLFYSNPADHFLGSDRKISVESGFSSSLGYNYSGNSKELLNSSSQDLFNPTPKISGCEGQTSNIDYQKYISQNLIFSKKGKSTKKFSFGRNENQWSDDEKKPLKTTEKQNENYLSEIKVLIGSLHEGIRKINTDISNVKDSVQGMAFEISKQNNKIGSFEELFYKQKEMMEEINVNCKNFSKKEDDNMTKIRKTLAESIKEIKNAVEKFNSVMETKQTKMIENIRKSSASQPSMNKKSIEQAKRSNEQFMRNIDIKINDMYVAFETYLKEIKNFYEEKLYENADDLKTLINSSNLKLREMISSQKANELKSGLYRNLGPAQQNEENIFGSARSGFSNHAMSARSISNLNSSYEWKNNKTSLYQNSLCGSAPRSVHTPLAEIINHNNRISLANRSLNVGSPISIREANISSYFSPPKRQLPRACKQKKSQKCTQLSFKKKTDTSQRKQPIKKNFRDGSKNQDTTFLKRVNDNKTSTLKKDDSTNYSNMRNRIMHMKTASTVSSPYQTLYEATMAEEFIFA